MSVCSHCKGAGQAPDKIILECVRCQAKVTVTFTHTADLVAKCDNVLCRECASQKVAP